MMPRDQRAILFFALNTFRALKLAASGSFIQHSSTEKETAFRARRRFNYFASILHSIK
jgi:hypothetical protein